MDIFTLYKPGKVPVYLRPPNIAEYLTKRKPHEIRKKYYCFISENTRWKSRVTMHYTKEADTDFKVKLAEIVVMGRVRKGDARQAVELLRANGYRTNPYSSNRCFGFYLSDFKQLDDVVKLLEDIAEALVITNTVWYLYYNRIINLRKLIENKFIPRIDPFKVVIGNINYTTVRVFLNGTVGVYGVHTPETIVKFGRQLYAFFREVGAVEE